MLIAGIDPTRLEALRATEAARFTQAHPKSAKALAAEAAHYLDGVPLHWMKDWPMPFLPVVDSAKGARITDIDGNQLHDFCLGDTGSMFGHSPAPVARAIKAQAANRPAAVIRPRPRSKRIVQTPAIIATTPAAVIMLWRSCMPSAMTPAASTSHAAR